MSDKPKNEDELPIIPDGFAPTLFDLIDWVFFAGAPIENEEEENDDEDDESDVRDDELGG